MLLKPSATIFRNSRTQWRSGDSIISRRFLIFTAWLLGYLESVIKLRPVLWFYLEMVVLSCEKRVKSKRIRFVAIRSIVFGGPCRNSFNPYLNQYVPQRDICEFWTLWTFCRWQDGMREGMSPFSGTLPPLVSADEAFFKTHPGGLYLYRRQGSVLCRRSSPARRFVVPPNLPESFRFVWWFPI